MLDADKAGHIGTLDPFAEGLLPVFVDRATRLIPYLEEGEKTYSALIMLGAESQTLDANGELVSSNAIDFAKYQSLLKDDALQIKQKLSELLGESRQEIPLYSAKKVHGRKLYEYARAKQEVEKQYKTINVQAANLLDWQGLLSKVELAKLGANELEQIYKERLNELKTNNAWLYPLIFPKAKSRLQAKKLKEALDIEQIKTWCRFTPVLYLHVEFTVSKGTFIRSLVASLGRLLGTSACTIRLLRTKVGQFELAKAQSEAKWHELFTKAKEAGQKLSSFGVDLKEVFHNLPEYRLSEKEYIWLVQGRTLTFYPKKQAKSYEYSTQYFLEKLINWAPMSIIKKRQFVLATYNTEVIALLNLQREVTRQTMKISGTKETTLTAETTGTTETAQTACLELGETDSFSLVPERILFSHEDL